MDLELFKARYEADRAHDIRLTATHGIDEVMKAHKLDALLFPGPCGAVDRRASRLSDGDGAVRDGPERADDRRSPRDSTRSRRRTA